jgi:hypothetical protein
VGTGRVFSLLRFATGDAPFTGRVWGRVECSRLRLAPGDAPFVFDEAVGAVAQRLLGRRSYARG